MNIFIWGALLALAYQAHALTIVNVPFYDYLNDTRVLLTDDRFDDQMTVITADSSFLFYGGVYTNMTLDNNGNVLFDYPLQSVSILCYEMLSNETVIALYLTDHSRGTDEENYCGEIYIGELVVGSERLRCIIDDLQAAGMLDARTFTPVSGVVVTFDDVCLLEPHSTRKTNVQLIYLQSGVSAFVILKYGGLGTPIPGDQHLCGSTTFFAFAGFRNVEENEYAIVPYDDQAATINTLSNVGIGGMFVFDVTEDPIIGASGSFDGNPNICEQPPCGDAVACDEDSQDEMTQCRKYGQCFPIGYSFFNEDCTIGCTCAQKKTSKPAKWSCKKLKEGKDPKPLCTDCATTIPTGDCSNVVFFEHCILPCLCGTHKSVCDGEIPCELMGMTLTAKTVKLVFKAKDIGKKMCDKCGDDTCICDGGGGASGLRLEDMAPLGKQAGGGLAIDVP